MFAILIALVASIACCSGTVVVSNSVTTAAGTLSYSIDYSGAGIVQQQPIETLVANDQSIWAAITGCSIYGASEIDGWLQATAANGNTAKATAEIDGPGASVTNYNLYGLVQPTSAWVGQYAESATGSNMWLDAIGEAEQELPMTKVGASTIEWAGSYVLTHPSSAPVYSLTNWYQDAMSGGTTLDNQWARADIYTGKIAVHSFDPLDWVDIYTGGEKKHSILGRTNIVWATGANEWVPQNNFIEIIGPSMGYADANIGYSNVDGKIASGQRVYTYWYKNWILGIDEQKVIYW
jgi:hypothetical protein